MRFVIFSFIFLFQLSIFGQSLLPFENVRDLAWNELLYSPSSLRRVEVLKAADSVTQICANIVGGSETEILACLWPEYVRKILRLNDELSANVKSLEIARTEKLTPQIFINAANRFGTDWQQKSNAVNKILEYKYVAKLLQMSTESLKSISSDQIWILYTGLAGISDFNPILEEASFLSAWVNSEEPIGFLNQLSKLTDRANTVINSLQACITSLPDKYTQNLSSEQNLKSHFRFEFAEIDLRNRDALNSLSLSKNQTFANSEWQAHLTHAIQLASLIKNQELNSLSDNLNSCQDMAHFYRLLGVDEETSKDNLLKCTLTRVGKRWRLSKALPLGSEFDIYFIQLNEIYRQRNIRTSARALRSIAVFRSLQKLKIQDQKCLPEYYQDLLNQFRLIGQNLAKGKP